MRLLATAIVATGVLAGCDDDLRLRNADYAYSYISATETYVSTQRFIGELYFLDLRSGVPVLEPLDHEIKVDEATDLRNNNAVNLESSRVAGAKVDVVKAGKTEASGTALFEAKITAEDAQVRRMTSATASDKIQELYAALWKPNTEMPLRAQEVLAGTGYYVLVSGAGLAEKLELSHGAPDGVTNGFSLTVAGKELSGVQIAKKDFFKCEKSGGTRTNCTAAITVYTAELSDAKTLDVKPTRKVKPAVVSAAFQEAFGG